MSKNESSTLFGKRTKKEILVEIEKLTDRVWHNRYQGLEQRAIDRGETVAPYILEGARKKAEAIQEKYGEENLQFDHDFEYGMINGKLSALRWIIGEDWGMLDT